MGPVESTKCGGGNMCSIDISCSVQRQSLSAISNMGLSTAVPLALGFMQIVNNHNQASQTGASAKNQSHLPRVFHQT
jgi:hypothetical protein